MMVNVYPRKSETCVVKDEICGIIINLLKYEIHCGVCLSLCFFLSLLHRVNIKSGRPIDKSDPNSQAIEI